MDDLRQSFERLLDSTRKAWLEGIGKIVDAPAGSKVAILPPEIAQSSSSQAVPIRLVDDPSAPAYFAFRVDDTHPYRAKELVQEVNNQLGFKRITSHTFQCIKQAHLIQNDSRYCYLLNYSSTRYSKALVEWIVEQIEANPSFLDEAKRKADELRNVKKR
jgi:EC042_2821-lke REase